PISKTMPPSAGRFPRMVPTAWTSPVNILIPTRFPLLSAGAVSRESAADEKIRAERARLHVFEADGLAHRRDAKRGKKAHRIASAEDARGDEGRNLIDLADLEECAVEAWSAFHKEADDVFFADDSERTLKAPIVSSKLYTQCLEGALSFGLDILAVKDVKRHLPGALREFGIHRKP